MRRSPNSSTYLKMKRTLFCWGKSLVSQTYVWELTLRYVCVSETPYVKTASAVKDSFEFKMAFFTFQIQFCCRIWKPPHISWSAKHSRSLRLCNYNCENNTSRSWFQEFIQQYVMTFQTFLVSVTCCSPKTPKPLYFLKTFSMNKIIYLLPLRQK
jgi:hypothetical protein